MLDYFNMKLLIWFEDHAAPWVNHDASLAEFGQCTVLRQLSVAESHNLQTQTQHYSLAHLDFFFVSISGAPAIIG